MRRLVTLSLSGAMLLAALLLCACAGQGSAPAAAVSLSPMPAETPVLVVLGEGGGAGESAAASAADTVSPSTSLSPSPEPEPTPTPVPAASTFSLRFVGDFMCCEYQMAAALREDGSYDFAPPFDPVREELAAADCTIGNLETNFYPDKPYHGTKKGFNAPESYLDAIKDCGVDVLVTANNHALDLNAAGALTTIEAVHAHGMDLVGTFASEDEVDDIYIREVKGVKVALLAYATRSNKQKAWFGDTQDNDATWVLNFYSQEKMARNIADAKTQGAEVIVLYLHAGYEKTDAPSKEQRRIFDEACDAGADVVIMSHTHSLLPMETRVVGEGENARTVFCAYGLGNFMSSALHDEALNNIIVNVDITYDFQQKRITALEPSYVLTYSFNYYENGELQFQIVPMRQGLLDFTGVVAPNTRKGIDALASAYRKMSARIGEGAAKDVYSFIKEEPAPTPQPGPEGTEG